jgi:hypothetical protein
MLVSGYWILDAGERAFGGPKYKALEYWENKRNKPSNSKTHCSIMFLGGSHGTGG